MKVCFLLIFCLGMQACSQKSEQSKSEKAIFELLLSYTFETDFTLHDKIFHAKNALAEVGDEERVNDLIKIDSVSAIFFQGAGFIELPERDFERAVEYYQASSEFYDSLQLKYKFQNPHHGPPIRIENLNYQREDLLVLMRADLIKRKEIGRAHV